MERLKVPASSNVRRATPSGRPFGKRRNDWLLRQRDIQDAALVKGVADARFFALLHIQEIICFLRLGGLSEGYLVRFRLGRGV